VPAEPRHPPSETTRDTRRSRHPGKLGLFVYIGAAMYMRPLLYDGDPHVEHFLCCTYSDVPDKNDVMLNATCFLSHSFAQVHQSADGR
jgi:hypothetical protein